MSHPNQSAFYALLIGINHYIPNTLYKDLRGCVRDIDLVDAYLKNSLGVPSSNIWKLTAPAPDDSALADIRSAERPPTYRNIVESFQDITNKAAPGEQVYIHYSGHGGRAKTLYGDIKGEEQSDESIVPTDFCALEGRYLRDVELATLLKQMTDKGLIVTIVLDSCHSGGATRGEDCDIRGGEAVDMTPQAMKSLVAPEEVLKSNWKALVDGSSATASPWLPAAREYVCLAACRPTERAYEYSANGKDRNGAFTFWMIDTLTNNSVSNLDYRSLYERVSAKIQSRFPNQLPMLMGEENRLVFGTDLANRPYTVFVSTFDLAKQQVTLKVGLAQGMSRGSRFAIYPSGTTEFSDPQQKLAVVEVGRLEATRCIAKMLPVEDGGLDVTAQLAANRIEVSTLEGAPAVMESAPADLKRRVRLVDDKAVGDRESELPADVASTQQTALQRVREALAGNGWLTEFGGDKEAHYQVAVDRTGTYEICMGLPLKNLRPPLAVDDDEAASKVVDRLVHLTKYQSVQELDNRVSRLTGWLQVELMQQPDWQPGETPQPIPFEDPNAIELSVNDFAFLKITNQSPIDLNVAILDLEPTWAIGKIPILGLPGNFYTMAPGESQTTPLQFALPNGPDDQPLYQQVTEVLKVFAAIGPADFSSLELSPLDVPMASKSAATRSAGETGSLNRLM
ncbi:MAG: caspase family protein, partial [Cyanobacteria bacterium P01_D01_bin.105]